MQVMFSTMNLTTLKNLGRDIIYSTVEFGYVTFMREHPKASDLNGTSEIDFCHFQSSTFGIFHSALNGKMINKNA